MDTGSQHGDFGYPGQRAQGSHSPPVIPHELQVPGEGAFTQDYNRVELSEIWNVK